MPRNFLLLAILLALFACSTTDAIPDASEPTTASTLGQIRFLNREYARRFAALNNLEGGRWLDEKHVLMKVIGFVSMILFFALAGAMGLSLIGNFSPFSRGVSIALTIITTVLGAISTFYFVKGLRGEPL
ncbi:MAG: hypothetical protein PVI78_04165 [Anaerolineales bacterium]